MFSEKTTYNLLRSSFDEQRNESKAAASHFIPMALCLALLATQSLQLFSFSKAFILSLRSDSTVSKEGRMLIDYGHKRQAYQSKQQRTSQVEHH